MLTNDDRSRKAKRPLKKSGLMHDVFTCPSRSIRLFILGRMNENGQRCTADESCQNLGNCVTSGGPCCEVLNVQMLPFAQMVLEFTPSGSVAVAYEYRRLKRDPRRRRSRLEHVKYGFNISTRG